MTAIFSRETDHFLVRIIQYSWHSSEMHSYYRKQMHLSWGGMLYLRDWSNVIPVNSKKVRYSSATILLNSLLQTHRLFRFSAAAKNKILSKGPTACHQSWFAHTGLALSLGSGVNVHIKTRAFYSTPLRSHITKEP